jgi:hypothetical protein
MGSFRRRVEALERIRWACSPPLTFLVTFVGAIDGGPEQLTPEETVALEAYKGRMKAEAKEGDIVCIEWTREKAQELLAQRPEPCVTD